MGNPIYYDSHMHTPLCKHAVGMPHEYAARGKNLGLKGIIMTCHSPMPDNFSENVRMSIEEFPSYVEMVGSTTEQFEGEFDVMLGLESDWFPGMEEWLLDLHQWADFHYVLGSVHPFIHEYRDRFYRGSSLEFQEGYFSHLAEAAETGLFDCLSHPDIVKTMVVSEWDFELVKGSVSSALDRIRETGISMELNTSGLNKSYPEMNPGSEMLRMMCERKIPVVVSSDSHCPERVGADFDVAFSALKEAGYNEVSCFKNRVRRDLDLDKVRDSLSGT